MRENKGTDFQIVPQLLQDGSTNTFVILIRQTGNVQNITQVSKHIPTPGFPKNMQEILRPLFHT